MHILFIGYGHTSQWLAKQLYAQGHQISTVSRTRKDDALGEHHTQDVASLDLSHILAVDIIYVLLAPSRSETLENAVQAYQKSYLESARRIVEQLKPRDFKRLIVVSSTRVYGENQGQEVNDSSVIQPADQQGQILREMELTYLAAFPEQTVIVRPSGIYGTSVERMKKMATQQHYPHLHWSNRIHIEDVVGFLAHLIHVEHVEKEYILTNNQPTLLHEVLQWFQMQMNLPRLAVIDLDRVTGKKLYATHLDQLGFQLKHQDCFEDYAALMQG
jgi:nucleoside-diphosphate-sugar epimerase